MSTTVGGVNDVDIALSVFVVGVVVLQSQFNTDIFASIRILPVVVDIEDSMKGFA